jgi:hypothetical protein
MISEEISERFELAVKRALSGNAVLIVGAGIGFKSININGEAIPSGQEFSRIIHEKLNLSDPLRPLDRVSQAFVNRNGAPAMYELLNQTFKVKSVDETFANFLNQNWYRIYTTNYDNVIEHCRPKNRSTFSINNIPKNLKRGSIIHLNGHIDVMTPLEVENSIVLTDSSYATSRFSNSKWAQIFRSDLKNAQAVIFVGYSLADLDISRILIEDQNLIRKSFFVLSPHEDEIDLETISKYGHVLPIGIDNCLEVFDRNKEFANKLSAGKNFQLLTDLSSELDGSRSQSAPRKIYDQLIYGQFEMSSLVSGEEAFAGQPFLVQRERVTQSLDKSETGVWRDLNISGDLASGKTMAAFQTAVSFKSKGYSVYWANNGTGLELELAELCEDDSPTVVVFDDYRHMLDAVKHYLAIRPSSHRAILVERSATNDLLFPVLFPNENTNPVCELVMDMLTDSDAEQFDALINFAGLWGERAGFDRNSRIRLIRTNLGGSLYRLLLEIIESQKVQNELKHLLDPIKKDENAFRFFTTAFIMNVLHYTFWISDWQTFYSIDSVKNVLSKHSESVGHFLNNDSATIDLRSGVLSAHLLRGFNDESMVKDCLVDMYGKALEQLSYDDEFARLRRDLMMYSVIEPLFGANKLANLLRYYEEIRPFGDTKNNPDYWLQLGIAATIHSNLAVAETAFTNAYSREKQKDNPNLTRIDNYFSRFELNKCIDVTDSSEAFTLFVSASRRLLKQAMFESTRHYPYKHGRLLAEIAATHFEKWDGDKQKKFLSFLDQIRDRAAEWKERSSTRNSDVDLLISESSKLLKQLRQVDAG